MLHDRRVHEQLLPGRCRVVYDFTNPCEGSLIEEGRPRR
jgi:hypothetical protein